MTKIDLLIIIILHLSRSVSPLKIKCLFILILNLIYMLFFFLLSLKANFPSGRRELNVSTYQMGILLLFNDSASVTLEAIEAISGVRANDHEIRRNLLSLCTPKCKILKKQSKGKGIINGDVFTFNEDFTSRLKRIKVPLISNKDFNELSGGPLYVEATKDDVVPASVEEDRRFLTEAAIVRVMKARKKMSHNDLVAEVSRQLSHRFSATPPLIKKRVEALIEREYLARDKDDARVYTYVA